MTMSEGDLAVTEIRFVRRATIEARPPPAAMTGAFGWLRANLLSTPVQHRADDPHRAAAGLGDPRTGQVPADRRGLDRHRPRRLPRDRAAPRDRRLLAVRLRSAGPISSTAPIRSRSAGASMSSSPCWRSAWSGCCGWSAAPRPRRGLFLRRAAGLLVRPAAPAGAPIGLPPVDTALWGGMLVTIVVASVGIVCSLPLGILLALGRRSRMPAVRLFSVIFIEFVRGVPLITVLFMASVMLPLFVPEEYSPDKLLRALVGVALFASAYMAEVVRAGLQAIPKGQYEGAMALGLGYWQMMRLIILPQALQDHHPEHRQHLYRPVQGHDAGVHRRHFRFPAHDRGRAHRSEMGDAGHQHDRLRGRRDVLLDLLLRHVALCARDGSPARQGRHERMRNVTVDERNRRADAHARCSSRASSTRRWRSRSSA